MGAHSNLSLSMCHQWNWSTRNRGTNPENGHKLDGKCRVTPWYDSSTLNEVQRMKLGWIGVLLAFVVLAVSVLPVSAHHAFALEYDEGRSILLKGVITKVEWKNPHTYVYIDVKDPHGTVERWALEGNPPNLLIRIGWMREMLKPGDHITVFGYLPRMSSDLAIANVAAGRRVTLADGHTLVFGIGR